MELLWLKSKITNNLFNNEGKKEWEFVNKDENGDIDMLLTELLKINFIDNFKSLVEKKECLN